MSAPPVQGVIGEEGESAKAAVDFWKKDRGE
jgi:hypothetical protein